MKNSLVVIVVTIVCFCSLSANAEGASGTIVDEKGRPLFDSPVLVKGKSLVLVAVFTPTDGGVPATVTWKSAPEGVVALKDEGAGKVRVTALRDWFDEKPGKEPTARVMACADALCMSVSVVCLPDLAGKWPARLLESFFGATEDRNLVFVQDGRSITFDPEPFNPPDPARVATMRLDGASLRLVKSGSVITRFDGTLTSRTTGKGNWASKWGFSGTWTANKVR